MESTQHNKIVGFIWGIADDVLWDLYVRGMYRDVILPMDVLLDRRLAEGSISPDHSGGAARSSRGPASPRNPPPDAGTKGFGKRGRP